MNGVALDPQTWNLITPYLDQALDIEPGQLESWLDDLGSTHAAIAALVRELMTELDRLNATGFLAEPIVTTDLAKLNVLRRTWEIGRK